VIVMKFGGSSAAAAAAIHRATGIGPREASRTGVVNAIICQTGMSVVRLFVSQLGIALRPFLRQSGVLTLAVPC
jgi:hypothetical protein